MRIGHGGKRKEYKGPYAATGPVQPSRRRPAISDQKENLSQRNAEGVGLREVRWFTEYPLGVGVAARPTNGLPELHSRLSLEMSNAGLSDTCCPRSNSNECKAMSRVA